MFDIRGRFLAATAYAVALLVMGTIGFAQLPGWSVFDAVYMTAITMTGLGYGEVHALDGAGRTLAIMILILGVTAMGIWFALITATIVEMDLSSKVRGRRLMKELDRLDGHLIVCGGGRMGRQIVRELRDSQTPYVVVERDPANIEEIREIDPDAVILEADATKDDTLYAAGILRARGLAAALSADADNLFLCLSAHSIKPELEIVARAFEEESRNKMLRAGADHVVSPLTAGGHHMVSLMLRPHAVNFLDVMTSKRDEAQLVLEQIPIPEPSAVAGLCLAEAQLHKKSGLVVLAIESGNGSSGTFIYNPGPEERLRTGDSLIVIGESEQIDRLRRAVA